MITSGLKAVQERAIHFALASELAQAKDLQNVLTLQSRYAQNQMRSYALQAQGLGWLMAESVRNVQTKS